MQPLFSIHSIAGHGYRVIRKGRYFIVERRWSGKWDGIYKMQITDEEHGEANALLGAIRKTLFFGDDLAKLGVCLSLIAKAGDGATASFADSLTKLTSLPRDAKIAARIPRELKDTLLVQKKELVKSTNLPLTLSDFLIYRLISGGSDTQ